jgi:hypothetical protein
MRDPGSLHLRTQDRHRQEVHWQGARR